jgi:hypothetical protein
VQTTLQYNFKIVYQVENPSKQDQRAVVQLLRVYVCQSTEICRFMYVVYGAAYVLPSDCKWIV